MALNVVKTLGFINLTEKTFRLKSGELIYPSYHLAKIRIMPGVFDGQHISHGIVDTMPYLLNTVDQSIQDFPEREKGTYLIVPNDVGVLLGNRRYDVVVPFPNVTTSSNLVNIVGFCHLQQ